MSETKFTKGEWRVERFVNGKGFEIAFNDDGEVITDYVYDEHDANLIAAAPEMYEMLESLREDYGLLTKVGKDIDKLLAKARGEKC